MRVNATLLAGATSSPSPLATDTPWASMADGTCVATGDNSSGQCNVSSWSGIEYVAAGMSHTVAMKQDGTCVAVGINDHGESTFRVPLYVDRMPVYRFFNFKKGVHFYTASDDEAQSVIDNLYKIYDFEGVAYELNVANPDNNVPLHRFFNFKKGVHFYTASEAEKNSVIAKLSATYRYEGVAYTVSQTPNFGTPVHRFFNFKNGVHFYTASEAEKNDVIARLSWTYRYEGIGYYIGN